MPTIPTEPGGAPQPPDPQAVLTALDEALPPVPVQIAYRLGLGLVALLMVLLPVVYVGLVGLAGWAVYYHATENLDWLEDHSGLGALMIYAGPLIIGGVLVLFMIKPLFARPPKGPEPYRVRRGAEPLLFAFVERLAGVVGAKAPTEITITMDVNAAAGFYRGMRGLVTGELSLIIGLPLMAGLDIKGFAGVLAHEFGHFAQRAGMRMTYVIRSINGWFSRVVWERDAWDERLKVWSESGTWHTIIIFLAARAFVWLTRGALWLLMMLGHLVSSAMLRQMEHDADRYEARLAGSETFVATQRALPVLGMVQQKTVDDLAEGYRERFLPDDALALFQANQTEVPDEVVTEVTRLQDEGRTGLFDSHPADATRIQRARALAEPGTFQPPDPLPALALLTDPQTLAREASLAFYRAQLGDELVNARLVPATEVLGRQGREKERRQALDRFFQGGRRVARPLGLPAKPPPPPASAEAARERLVQIRERLSGNAAETTHRLAALDRTDDTAAELASTFALISSGLPLGAIGHEAELSGAETWQQARKRFWQESGELDPLDRLATERLGLALSLRQTPEVAGRLDPEAASPDEIQRWWQAAVLLDSEQQAFYELRDDFAGLAALTERLEGREEDHDFVQAVLDQVGKVARRLRDFRTRLGQVPYPFDHADGEVPLVSQVVPEVPAPDDLGTALRAGSHALEQLYRLHFRLSGCLARAAERIEQALGLDPLPDPPEAPATNEPPE